MTQTLRSSFLGTLPALAAAALLVQAVGAQVRFARHAGISLANEREMWADVASADFDGDGRTDLLVARDRGGAYVLRQGPGGAFEQSMGLPSWPARYVAIGDVDGDGDPDAVLAGGQFAYSTIGHPSSVARNNGSSWSAASCPSYRVESSGVELADLDGDQDLDAVFFIERHGEPLPGVHVWHNDGAGNFTDVTAASVGTIAGRSVDSGTVLDADGDGDQDIVYGFGQTTYLLVNDGTGVFTEQPLAGPSWATIYGAVDTDGDGDDDVVTAAGVLRNDAGAGLTFLSGGFQCTSADLADLDGDGDLDLCGVGNGSQSAYAYRNDGNNQFSEVSAAWIPTSARFAYFNQYTGFGCSEFADLDGDGFGDLVTGGSVIIYSSNTVGVPPALLWNDGGNGFSHANPIAMPEALARLSDVAVHDMDGDRRPDLIVNGATLLQSEGGEYGLGSRIWPGSEILHREFADFDGDGDDDQIVLSGILEYYYFTSGQHRYYENVDGTFTERTPTHVPPGSASAATAVDSADVDGDGDLDLVVASYSDPLALWINQGDGRFIDGSAQLPSPSGGIELSAITFADVDGDGDADLVGVRGFAEQPASSSGLLYLNDGSGTFADGSGNLPTYTARSLDYVGRIWTYDREGDGDVDIVVPGYVLVNDGAANFTLASTGNVAYADFDEDGVPDPLPPYSQLQLSRCQNTTPVVYTADVDGDEDIDLIYGCRTPNFDRSFDQEGMEVIFNQRRDIRFASPPRLGKSCRIACRATNTTGSGATDVAVGLSLSRLATPVRIQSWGELWLDPATMAVVSVVTVPNADTVAEAALNIPALSALLGSSLTVQGLFLPAGDPSGTHFSAAVTKPFTR